MIFFFPQKLQFKLDVANRTLQSGFKMQAKNTVRSKGIKKLFRVLDNNSISNETLMISIF